MLVNAFTTNKHSFLALQGRAGTIELCPLWTVATLLQTLGAGDARSKPQNPMDVGSLDIPSTSPHLLLQVLGVMQELEAKLATKHSIREIACTWHESAVCEPSIHLGHT